VKIISSVSLLVLGLAVAAHAQQQSGAQQDSQQGSAYQQRPMNQQPLSGQSNQGQSGQVQSDQTQSGQLQSGLTADEQQQITSEDLSKDEIRNIQQSLNRMGFNAGDVDGVWGAETKEALKTFQQRQGLESTGEVDQDTLAALGVGGQNGMSGQEDVNTGSATGNEANRAGDSQTGPRQNNPSAQPNASSESSGSGQTGNQAK
jgi:peptidoglycan hydrolase-like protein with peptidoglycan-binding domain